MADTTKPAAVQAATEERKVLEVTRPAAGETKVYGEDYAQGSDVRMRFDLKDTTQLDAVAEGDNLVINFKDGAKVELQDFYKKFSKEQQLIGEDGKEELTAFLEALVDKPIETALGPSATAALNSASFREYTDLDLLEGISHLRELDWGMQTAVEYNEERETYGVLDDDGVDYPVIIGDHNDGGYPGKNDPDDPFHGVPDKMFGAGNLSLMVNEAKLPGIGTQGNDADGNPLPNNPTDIRTLHITAQDGVASIVVGGKTVFENGQFVEGVEIKVMSGTLTVTGFDPATGNLEFKYTLDDPTTKHDQKDNNDFVNELVPIVVTDTDGDRATGNINVIIKDDIPSAYLDNAGELNNDVTSVTGNVIAGTKIVDGKPVSTGAKDSYGADGEPDADSGIKGFEWDIDKFSADYKQLSGPTDDKPDAPYVFETPYGKATLEQDGTYTIERDKTASTDIPGGKGELDFPYIIRDADGDPASSKLHVDIMGNKPVGIEVPGDRDNDPENQGVGTNNLTLTVYEAGLPARDGEPAGSHVGEDGYKTIATGKLHVDAGDGIKSITVNDVEVVDADGKFTGLSIPTTDGSGTLYVTGFNADGDLEFRFELTDNMEGGVQGADTLASKLPAVKVTVTDKDGDIENAYVNVKVVDDVPKAQDDVNGMKEADVTLEVSAAEGVLTGAHSVDPGKADAFGADGTPATNVVMGVVLKDAQGNYVTDGEGNYVVTNLAYDTDAGQNVTKIEDTYGTLTLRADGSYTYTLTKDVPANEDNTPVQETFRYVIADSDGDTDTAVLTLNITPDGRVPSISFDDTTPEDGANVAVSGKAVDEAGLANGGTKADDATHGALEKTKGTIDYELNKEAGTITIGQGDNTIDVAVSAEGVISFPDGNTITTGKGVLTLSVADGKLTYSYELKTAQTHDQNNENATRDVFEVSIKDATGDTNKVPAQLVITIKDDAPDANDDYNIMREGQDPISGNVYTGVANNGEPDANSKDTIGADGPHRDANGDIAPVTKVQSEVGGSVEELANGAFVIQGAYGELTLYPDGQYTYELNQDVPNGQIVNDTFTYTIKDADGDSTTADLKIDIVGKTTATTKDEYFSLPDEKQDGSNTQPLPVPDGVTFEPGTTIIYVGGSDPNSPDGSDGYIKIEQPVDEEGNPTGKPIVTFTQTEVHDNSGDKDGIAYEELITGKTPDGTPIQIPVEITIVDTENVVEVDPQFYRVEKPLGDIDQYFNPSKYNPETSPIRVSGGTIQYKENGWTNETDKNNQLFITRAGEEKFTFVDDGKRSDSNTFVFTPLEDGDDGYVNLRPMGVAWTGGSVDQLANLQSRDIKDVKHGRYEETGYDYGTNSSEAIVLDFRGQVAYGELSFHFDGFFGGESEACVILFYRDGELQGSKTLISTAANGVFTSNSNDYALQLNGVDKVVLAGVNKLQPNELGSNPDGKDNSDFNLSRVVFKSDFGPGGSGTPGSSGSTETTDYSYAWAYEGKVKVIEKDGHDDPYLTGCNAKFYLPGGVEDVPGDALLKDASLDGKSVNIKMHVERVGSDLSAQSYKLTGTNEVTGEKVFTATLDPTGKWMYEQFVDAPFMVPGENGEMDYFRLQFTNVDQDGDRVFPLESPKVGFNDPDIKGKPSEESSVLDPKWYGTDNNDTLTGTEYADTLYGRGGDDILHGKDGNDMLLGGTGNDTLHGDGGDDTLHGGLGNDQLDGGDGNDILYGDDLTLIKQDGNSTDDRQGNDPMKLWESESTNTWNNNYTHTTDKYVKDEHGNIVKDANGDPIPNKEYRGGDDILHGGAGNDTIYGGLGDDKLYGDKDNDHLYGGEGNDTLEGGAGSDTLFGGNDDDVIFGDSAIYTQGVANLDDITETIKNASLAKLNEIANQVGAGDAADTLYGGAGNDTLFGGGGNDSLRGGDGNDSLFGGDGADRLYGDAGNDYIEGGAGDDYVEGGAGDDTIYGGEGNDTLYGYEGDDVVHGGTGNDSLYGYYGNDTLHGEEGDDRIWGGHDDDHLYGGDGDDELHGEQENDRLFGGAGNDRLYGDEGNDTLHGEAGNDYMEGGSGDDVLFGGEGNDHLLGGAGNDFLDGGSGTDKLQGGAGSDILVYHAGDQHWGEAGIDVLLVNTDDGTDVASLLNGNTGKMSGNNGGLEIFLSGSNEELQDLTSMSALKEKLGIEIRDESVVFLDPSKWTEVDDGLEKFRTFSNTDGHELTVTISTDPNANTVSNGLQYRIELETGAGS